MRVLLVTLAIGEDPRYKCPYIHTYNRLFRASQEAYAARCGYDFRIITEFLDKSYYHVSLIMMQKWLVASQDWSAHYDYVVFVDADILISSTAPPIHLAADFRDSIGMVDEYSQPTREERLQIQKRNGWECSAREYYSLCGFDVDTTHVLNSGVLVLQPAKHGALLQELYEAHFEEMIGNPRTVYEQTALAYELLKRGLVHIMPNTWNALVAYYLKKGGTEEVQAHVDSFYFSHFAGHVAYDAIPLLRPLT